MEGAEVMERPILFSAPMVRAVQSGAKTQTRRAMKHQPFARPEKRDDENAWDVYAGDELSGTILCPHGQPGDRLYVRETWARDEECGEMMYRADLGQGGGADDWERGRLDGVQRYRWRPSIHMPRWASRITLEIVSVRVERLNDITEFDASAEGCKAAFVGNRFAGYGTAFAQLWESINGAGSWDANPWVWVVEFRKVPQ